jgi:arsenical pump membrane protein
VRRVDLRAASSVLLFAAVLAGVVRPPRRLGIGWVAVIGGAVAVAAGLVTPADLVRVTRTVADATLAFVGIVLLALVMDAAGLFAWAARHLTRAARGDTARLFLGSLVLGALVSAVFSNDGAALILTPILFEQVRAARLPQAAMLAFVIAGGFVADATSLPLVVSNLVNIIVADFFRIGFVGYARIMAPVDLVALGASAAVLWALLGRHLPRRLPRPQAEDPAAAVPDRALFRGCWAVLAALAVAYPLGERLGLPVAVPVGAAAAAAVGLAWKSPAVSARRLVLEAPWRIIAFAAGMYVVVYGLASAGLTADLASVVGWAAAHGRVTGVLVTGGLAAALSSVANNLPATLLGTLAVHGAHLPGPLRQSLALAVVVGCDLGTKFTPIGSLATLLWLAVLDRRGLTVPAGRYLAVGAAATLPVLLAALLTLCAVTAWRI